MSYGLKKTKHWRKQRLSSFKTTAFPLLCFHKKKTPTFWVRVLVAFWIQDIRLFLSIQCIQPVNTLHFAGPDSLRPVQTCLTSFCAPSIRTSDSTGPCCTDTESENVIFRLHRNVYMINKLKESVGLTYISWQQLAHTTSPVNTMKVPWVVVISVSLVPSSFISSMSPHDSLHIP